MYLSKLWIVCRRRVVQTVGYSKTKGLSIFPDGCPVDEFGRRGVVSI